MNDEKIKEAVEFVYDKQGYADITLLVRMTKSPDVFIRSWLIQNGFHESFVPGQFLKGPVPAEKRIISTPGPGRGLIRMWSNEIK